MKADKGLVSGDNVCSAPAGFRLSPAVLLMSLPAEDHDYFLALQTRTGWGKTLARFLEWCLPDRPVRVLDVGAGPALASALAAQRGHWVVGVDRDPLMLAQSLHPTVALADAGALPFGAGAFDLTLASNLLYLLPDPLPALREMARVTAPGGYVAVLNPSERMSVAAARALADARGLTGLARETLLNLAARAEACYRWSPADLGALFARVGLRLVRTRTAMRPGLLRWALAEVISPRVA